MIMEQLTRPLGPLQVWQWGLVVAGGYLGYKFLTRNSNEQSDTAETIGVTEGGAAIQPGFTQGPTGPPGPAGPAGPSGPVGPIGPSGALPTPTNPRPGSTLPIGKVVTPPRAATPPVATVVKRKILPPTRVAAPTVVSHVLRPPSTTSTNQLRPAVSTPVKAVQNPVSRPSTSTAPIKSSTLKIVAATPSKIRTTATRIAS